MKDLTLQRIVQWCEMSGTKSLKKLHQCLLPGVTSAHSTPQSGRAALAQPWLLRAIAPHDHPVLAPPRHVSMGPSSSSLAVVTLLL